jgi:hypothetical protein
MALHFDEDSPNSANEVIKGLNISIEFLEMIRDAYLENPIQRVIELPETAEDAERENESTDEQEDSISADLLPHEYDPENDEIDDDEDEYPTDIDYVIRFLRDMAESQQYFRPEMN